MVTLPTDAAPVVIIVMGVAGCGKTTVAKLLSERLAWTYLEADDFHSVENISKMSAGIPLTDADRAPWLDAIAERIAELQRAGHSAVFTCSALRRVYRDRLRAKSVRGSVRFVYLQVPEGELERRLAQRQGHYMKLEMLRSQLQTLEEPSAEEEIVVDGMQTPGAIADDVWRALHILPGAGATEH